MIIYKCSKCGSFIASFKDINNYTIKAKKGIKAEGNKLILKCKCGHVTKINTEFLK